MAARLDDLVTKALVFRNMSAEKVWLQYGLYVGTRVLDIVLCIAFIAVAIGLINKAYIYKKDEMSVKEMVMLIIPSLVGVTGYGILQYYLMIYERDTGKNLIDMTLYNNIEKIAPKLIAKQRQIFKGVSPNIDFYSGFVYDMLNIPRELYTPLFAIARIAGWSAHRLEELITTDKIIRPAYKSLVRKKEYIEREER